MTEHQLFLFLVEVTLVVVAARLGGELAIRLGVAQVVGELVAGILLGPLPLRKAVARRLLGGLPGGCRPDPTRLTGFQAIADKERLRCWTFPLSKPSG